MKLFNNPDQDMKFYKTNKTVFNKRVVDRSVQISRLLELEDELNGSEKEEGKNDETKHKEKEDEDEEKVKEEDDKEKKEKDKEKEIKEAVDPMVARLEKSLSWINR